MQTEGTPNLFRPENVKNKPLKLIRNVLLYPDAERRMIVSGLAGILALSDLFLGPPGIFQAALIPAGLIMLAQHSGLVRGTREVNDFLRVRETRNMRSRLFPDGSSITLDDSIGELHLNSKGLAKIKDEQRLVRRSLILGAAVLEGLVELADKVEHDHPDFKQFGAFRGTSSFVHPHFARKLGFEVRRPGAFTNGIYSVMLPVDKFLSHSPVKTGKVNIAWISRDGLIHNKGKMQEELVRIQKYSQL